MGVGTGGGRSERWRHLGTDRAGTRSTLRGLGLPSDGQWEDLMAGSDVDGISERMMKAQSDPVTCSLNSGHRGSSGNEKGPLEYLSENVELDT